LSVRMVYQPVLSRIASIRLWLRANERHVLVRLQS
jgi:hypothetical protein